MAFSTAMPFPPLPESLAAALTARGYAEPTPVQASILTTDHSGRDLMVSARTGSGKTVAFGLALAAEVLEEQQGVRALVVAPTRELALQVARELEWLYRQSRLRVVTCVGGMDPIRESRLLRAGAEVVVGTPGRLCDHLSRGALSLASVRGVVLDEADEMLDMGFREELEQILEATPPTRRTLLFSATMPDGIERLAARYQRQALRIAQEDASSPHADIRYELCAVAEREREHAIVNVLREREPKGALVFCATREGVGRLAGALAERGFGAVALSGDLTQAERGRALSSLRDGRAQVLVATDVAARGLDLPALDLVIHADIPNDPAVLLHRSGRTGRAGRKGTALILVPPVRWRKTERIIHLAGVEPTWVDVPTAAMIHSKDQERLAQEALAAISDDQEIDDLEVARIILEKQSAEQLVAAFVRTLRARRPAPEELVETRFMVQRLKGPKRPVKAPVRGAAEPARPPHPEARPAVGPPPREEHAAAPGADERSHPGEFTGARERGGEPGRGALLPRPQQEFTGAPREERVWDGPPGGAPSPRGPATERERPPPRAQAPGIWFRISIGRARGADPKWLIPLICRRGGITKREIGAIRVLARETRFEIAVDVADRFAQSAVPFQADEPDVEIAPLDGIIFEPNKPPKRKFKKF